MQRGAIRGIQWGGVVAATSGTLRVQTGLSREMAIRSTDAIALGITLPGAILDTGSPTLDPMPASAEDEAIALLRIAAEVEGCLLAQYLYAAASVLQGVTVSVPGFDHVISSDDWYDVIRTIAKQEMGHLITVQNLLLSLGATPHLDRENMPTTSPLFPFEFGLERLKVQSLAKYVCAEAPGIVAPGDQADLDAAKADVSAAGAVQRAGQIYERLFWLFQDADAPQEPWLDLRNPFPHWPNWHINPTKIGLNQDRQASAGEWRGTADATESPDSAIYVLQTQDKATGRSAMYAIGLQGEGPSVSGDLTHFDKFLRLFREQRAVDQQAGSPSFTSNQSDRPSVAPATGAPTITDPTTATWAKLGNARYQMLLVDIALSLSLGAVGSIPSTTAKRTDFIGWSFREMQACIKPVSEELRHMPLTAGASPDSPRAGFPFEMPSEDLPTEIAQQLDYLRSRLAVSAQLRARIRSDFSPTPKQLGILAVMDNIDSTMNQRLGAAPPPS